MYSFLVITHARRVLVNAALGLPTCHLLCSTDGHPEVPDSSLEYLEMIPDDQGILLGWYN